MLHKCVLVVEDEKPARDVICESLEDLGCETMKASDGTEAIRELESHGRVPCVILLDLMMAGMNGWQFREWQRQNERFANVPVVVLSAVRNLGEEAKKLGVNGYLEKPFSFSKLLTAVTSHCGPCQLNKTA